LSRKISEIFSISKYLVSVRERFDHYSLLMYLDFFIYSSTALIHYYESGNLAEDCKHFECA